MDRISNGCGELTTLLAVLSHGQEQTRQLKAHLDVDPSMHQLVLCKSLARQIELTFQTAISVVERSSHKLTRMGTDSSPTSATDSLQSSKSPDRDRAFDDVNERMETWNKRKNAFRWTRQVRVCPVGGIEEPVVDGYSWRKYGQKDILGAKYPRGYYRCTHRNSRGCLATKQVQRSDEDPFILDVTYRGEHTCTESKHETTVVEASLQQDTGINSQNNDLLQQLQKQHALMSLRAPLVQQKTDDDLNSKGQILDSSSFFSYTPSTPAASCMQLHDSNICSPTTLENSFIDTFSPAFMLARTSEMNYLPLSRCGVSNYGAQETELLEMISSARSTATTPISDMDFCFRQGDFGTDFPFDGASF